MTQQRHSSIATYVRPRWTHQAIFFLDVFIRSLTRENEVEDTTAAVLMVDKYGGKDTPGDMAVKTRLPTHALYLQYAKIVTRNASTWQVNGRNGHCDGWVGVWGVCVSVCIYH